MDMDGSWFQDAHIVDSHEISRNHKDLKVEGVSLGGFTHIILIDYSFNLFTSSSSSHSPEKYAPADDCQSGLFKLMAIKIVLAGN